MSECKGLIYRGKLQVFMNVYGGYERHETMVLVSTQSCPGCDQCKKTEADLRSFIAGEVFPTIEDFQDAALYRLEYNHVCSDGSTDIKSIVRRVENKDMDDSGYDEIGGYDFVGYDEDFADEYEMEFIRMKQ